MRIEINAGGLGGSIAISEFQSDISKFISNVDSVISSFKTVKNEIYDVNSGTTNLQEALDNVEARINLEEEKKESAQKVQRKAENFLDLVVRIDKQVAEDVNKNKEAFYKTNPWLRPPTSVDPDKVWYEQAWEWICGTAEEIAKDVKVAWADSTLKKIWDGLVEFYTEHKKIIDTILIVVGAIASIVAVVVTGGAALVPLLGVLGFSGSVAATVSTIVAVIAVSSTILSSLVNIVDIWGGFDDPTFNMFQKVLNFTSTASNLLYNIGGMYNSWKGISNSELKVMKNMNSSEIKTVVKQDFAIKRYEKMLAKNPNKNIANGNYAEMKQDQLMREMGYSWYDSERIKPTFDYVTGRGKGIDGMYINNKGNVVIGEAKYNTARFGNTNYGKQMSDDWIFHHLDDAFGETVADDIIINGYDRIHTHLYPKTSSIEMTFLDNSAKETGRVFNTFSDVFEKPQVYKDINLYSGVYNLQGLLNAD